MLNTRSMNAGEDEIFNRIKANSTKFGIWFLKLFQNFCYKITIYKKQ